MSNTIEDDSAEAPYDLNPYAPEGAALHVINDAPLDLTQENTVLAARVKEAAELASIAIDQEGLTQMTKDVVKILDLTHQLNQVDTSKIKPMAHPLELHHHHNSLRRDKITEPQNIPQRDQLQQLAPQTAEGFYCVPAFIEEQTDETVTD